MSPEVSDLLKLALALSSKELLSYVEK